jgi:hypothetical protein
MPLVVLAKGKVAYKKGDMPRIGWLFFNNQIFAEKRRLQANRMLSKSMSLIQSSLLKGK